MIALFPFMYKWGVSTFDSTHLTSPHSTSGEEEPHEHSNGGTSPNSVGREADVEAPRDGPGPAETVHPGARRHSPAVNDHRGMKGW